MCVYYIYYLYIYKYIIPGKGSVSRQLVADVMAKNDKKGGGQKDVCLTP